MSAWHAAAAVGPSLLLSVVLLFLVATALLAAGTNTPVAKSGGTTCWLLLGASS